MWGRIHSKAKARTTRHAFERVDELGELDVRWVVHQEMHVIMLAVELGEFGAELHAYIRKELVITDSVDPFPHRS